MSICGKEGDYAAVSEGSEIVGSRVIQFLTRERRNGSSIRSCLRAARENARVGRDRISVEMWEDINDLEGTR